MAQKKTKSDLELRKKIKAMESKKREKTLEAARVTRVKGDENDKKISFDQWWMLVCKAKSLKPWMKEILLADFRARGLSKSESEEKYNEALKLFGVK